MSSINETLERLLKESSEPLHPDLVPYFEADGALGAQVRHPLVYQVPLWSNGSANAYYLQKKKDLETALTEKNYSRVVYLHERPYRLQAFIQIQKYLSDEKYWSLLASVWTDTENAWQHLDEWRELFNSSTNIQIF
jgi:hypothetical protein